jgi:mRNA interferase MazF
MGQFVRGEVVVIPFPFADLSQSKRRPALVLATLPGDDLILCMITSQLTRVAESDPYAVALHEGDFVRGKLQQRNVRTLTPASYVRVNRLFTADEANVIKSVGQISAARLAEVVTRVVAMIGGKE